ncbi:MAG: HEAT repeat domain-containing protein [Sandaracinaceae bacterium]
MRTTSLAIVFFAASMTACGTGPRARVAAAADTGHFDPAYAAYLELERSEGADEELLARVAGALLEEEAGETDDARSRAALSQLTLAGTAGEPILDRLSRASGRGPGRRGALEILARRGREHAILALRAMADDPDPAAVTSSVLGMDPEADRALLLASLDATHGPLRAAAAARLAPVADRAEVREALEEMARVDPLPSARAAAVRSLARAGEGALDALRERLSDADGSVRTAAVDAIFEADRAAARETLGPLLAIAPSASGIEAARLLAEPDPNGANEEDAALARAFLQRALTASDAALRAQAGVALAGLSLAAESPTGAVLAALETEQDPFVKLSFARALARRARERAFAVLEELLGAEGMPRAQAAALLATERHERAIEVLREIVGNAEADSIDRRTAVRALARDAMRPDLAERSLLDDDALVRIHAAGGILAAAAARR